MKHSYTAFLAILAIAMVCFNGCNKSTDPVSSGGSTEQGIVRIGTQVWTSVNLNVNHYRNGDSIPQVQNSSEWGSLTTGAWCYYENDTAYGRIYGKLYNWYAVTDSRGLAPSGWHIPSDSEWTTLSDYLGGSSVAGGKMKAKTLWRTPNAGASNISSFTALPGGYRISNGTCESIGESAYFLSVTDIDVTLAWTRGLYYYASDVIRYGGYKNYGYSVRCVRDN